MEGHIGFLQTTLALDINRFCSVDENIRYGWIREQWLERTEPHDLVFDRANNSPTLLLAQCRGVFIQNSRGDFTDLAARLVFGNGADQRQIHNLQQLLVGTHFPFALALIQGSPRRFFRYDCIQRIRK